MRVFNLSGALTRLASPYSQPGEVHKVQSEFEKSVYNDESELERGGGPPFQFKNLEEGSQAPTEWIRSCRRGNQAIGRIWTLELALKACGKSSSTAGWIFYGDEGRSRSNMKRGMCN